MLYFAVIKDTLHTYGVDVEAGLPEYNEDAASEEGVIVPETLNPLDETAFAIFLERICAVERTDPWDIEPYLRALQTLEDLLHEYTAPE